MKSKIVLWGENEAGKKLLVGLSLNALSNEVTTYLFDENIVTEEFYNTLSNKWTSDSEENFPEGFQKQTNPLSPDKSLLPDGIKVDNVDIIQRTQTSWYFAVLSAKLNSNFEADLDVIKDKVAAASDYSQALWNDLKSLWENIQNQIRQKNLFGEAIDNLKAKTNSIFEELKDKRKLLEKDISEKSQKIKIEYLDKIQIIEDKIEKGMSLHPIFEDLKKLQNSFKSAILNHVDRKMIWDKLDNAFKIVKEKRYDGKNDKNPSNSSLDRLSNRYDGLLSAIHKMESSIRYDEKELEFLSSKIENTSSQLESQIREAKLKIILERVQSKKVKLLDMEKTKEDLTAQKLRLEKEALIRKEKETLMKEAEHKIKDQIKEDTASRESIQTDLMLAAQKIVEAKKSKENAPLITENNVSENINISQHDLIPETNTDDTLHTPIESNHTSDGHINSAVHTEETNTLNDESLLNVIGTTLLEGVQGFVDNVRAIADVMEDKIEDKIDEIKESILSAANESTEKQEEINEEDQKISS